MARAERIQEVLIFVLFRLETSVLFCARREVLRISGVSQGSSWCRTRRDLLCARSDVNVRDCERVRMSV